MPGWRQTLAATLQRRVEGWQKAEQHSTLAKQASPSGVHWSAQRKTPAFKAQRALQQSLGRRQALALGRHWATAQRSCSQRREQHWSALLHGLSAPLQPGVTPPPQRRGSPTAQTNPVGPSLQQSTPPLPQSSPGGAQLVGARQRPSVVSAPSGSQAPRACALPQHSASLRQRSKAGWQPGRARQLRPPLPSLAQREEQQSPSMMHDSPVTAQPGSAAQWPPLQSVEQHAAPPWQTSPAARQVTAARQRFSPVATLAQTLEQQSTLAVQRFPAVRQPVPPQRSLASQMLSQHWAASVQAEPREVQGAALQRPAWQPREQQSAAAAHAWPSGLQAFSLLAQRWPSTARAQRPEQQSLAKEQGWLVGWHSVSARQRRLVGSQKLEQQSPCAWQGAPSAPSGQPASTTSASGAAASSSSRDLLVQAPGKKSSASRQPRATFIGSAAGLARGGSGRGEIRVGRRARSVGPQRSCPGRAGPCRA